MSHVDHTLITRFIERQQWIEHISENGANAFNAFASAPAALRNDKEVVLAAVAQHLAGPC